MQHGYEDPYFCSYFAARGTQNQPPRKLKQGEQKQG